MTMPRKPQVRWFESKSGYYSTILGTRYRLASGPNTPENQAAAELRFQEIKGELPEDPNRLSEEEAAIFLLIPQRLLRKLARCGEIVVSCRVGDHFFFSLAELTAWNEKRLAREKEKTAREKERDARRKLKEDRDAYLEGYIAGYEVGHSLATRPTDEEIMALFFTTGIGAPQ